MSKTKWETAVRDAIARLAKKRGTNIFTPKDLWDEEQVNIVKHTATSGNTPYATLRNTLRQKLVKDNYITVVQRGRYQLMDTDVTPECSEATTVGEERIPTVVDRIVRDPELVRNLKALYENRCQLCDTTVELKTGYYCEAHHVRPLGNPHNGPDTKSNLLVVCPNCHVKLDFAAIQIETKKFRSNKHKIAQAYVDYHNARCSANK